MTNYNYIFIVVVEWMKKQVISVCDMVLPKIIWMGKEAICLLQRWPNYTYECKINIPNLVTYPNWTKIFESMYLKAYMWLQERIPNKHVLKKHWTTCLNYDNFSMLNSQHNWWGADLYDLTNACWASCGAPTIV